MEKWKNIEGAEGYQVSSRGRVRSLDRTVKSIRRGKEILIFFKGKLLKFDKKINGAGYYGVSLGKRKDAAVHILVAIAFVGPKPFENAQVNHDNCNKLDNHYKNLKWCTPSNNIQHALKNGRMDDFKKMMSNKSRHEGNPKAKLNWKKVEKIRQLCRKGVFSKDIAVKFKVSLSTIAGIRQRRYWVQDE